MHWLLVKIICFLTRHGLDGNSLEQGEEGAISPICRPQVDLGSGHPLVLGDSHPFVILDSTLLPSSHSFCSLSLSPCQLQVVLILGPSVPSETVKT